jgi:hypothetical protein
MITLRLGLSFFKSVKLLKSSEGRPSIPMMLYSLGVMNAKEKNRWVSELMGMSFMGCVL